MSHCSQLSVFLFKFNELTIEILYFSPTSLNFPLYKVGIIINWLLSVRKQNSDWQIDMLYFRVFCNFSNRIKIGKIIQSLRECKNTEEQNSSPPQTRKKGKERSQVNMVEREWRRFCPNKKLLNVKKKPRQASSCSGQLQRMKTNSSFSTDFPKIKITFHKNWDRHVFSQNLWGLPNNTLTAKSFLRIFHHFFFLL
ncbi:unnamed protein product, partial [Vitis vinifera]